MTNAQKNLLEKIDNQYATYEKLMRENGGKSRDGVNDAWWVENFKNGIITIEANTKTLECLERLGYIKLLSRDDGRYANFDTLKRIF